MANETHLPAAALDFMKTPHPNLCVPESVGRESSFYPRGTLLARLKIGHLGHWAIRKYMNQIAGGLRHLHRHGYAHCNLSLTRIYLGQDEQCKLGGFEHMCPVSMHSVGPRGADRYMMAPEMLQETPCEPVATDSWSLGVCLFYLLTDRAPMVEASGSNPAFQALQHGGVTALLEYHEVKNINTLPIDLLNGMLSIDPLKRLTIAQILSHVWIQHAERNTSPILTSFIRNPIETRRPSLKLCQAELDPASAAYSRRVSVNVETLLTPEPSSQHKRRRNTDIGLVIKDGVLIPQPPELPKNSERRSTGRRSSAKEMIVSLVKPIWMQSK